MNRPIAAAVLAVLGCVLVAGCKRTPEHPPQSAAHESGPATSHDPHAEHGTAPVLAEGQRWATDEPLRAAMMRIREAVERNTPAFEQGKLQAADAQSLAAAVENDIAYMVANCKLEPDPDAALHVLIGRMMSAATVLKADPASETGLPQLVAVLHEYQSTFDHPDWAPLDRAH